MELPPLGLIQKKEVFSSSGCHNQENINNRFFNFLEPSFLQSSEVSDVLKFLDIVQKNQTIDSLGLLETKTDVSKHPGNYFLYSEVVPCLTSPRQLWSGVLGHPTHSEGAFHKVIYPLPIPDVYLRKLPEVETDMEPICYSGQVIPKSTIQVINQICSSSNEEGIKLSQVDSEVYESIHDMMEPEILEDVKIISSLPDFSSDVDHSDNIKSFLFTPHMGVMLKD